MLTLLPRDPADEAEIVEIVEIRRQLQKTGKHAGVKMLLEA